MLSRVFFTCLKLIVNFLFADAVIFYCIVVCFALTISRYFELLLFIHLYFFLIELFWGSYASTSSFRRKTGGNYFSLYISENNVKTMK